MLQRLLDLEAAHQRDRGLQIVALLAGDAQLAALHRGLHLELAVLDLAHQPPRQVGVDALLERDRLAQRVARRLFRRLEVERAGLDRVRCTFSNSCICFSLRSSSAVTVISLSLRSIAHLLPLKSKRVVISRLIPASALSTSARSMRDTMSKLGTAAPLREKTAVEAAI
jgi:hypothetical protein